LFGDGRGMGWVIDRVVACDFVCGRGRKVWKTILRSDCEKRELEKGFTD
jgi:hypothetical protein